MEQKITTINRYRVAIINFSVNTRKVGKIKQTLGYLTSRKGLLEQYWQNYGSLYNEIINSDHNEPAIKNFLDKDNYDEIEGSYSEAMGELSDGIESLVGSNSRTTRANLYQAESDEQNSSIHVPPCDTQVFTGDYVSWPTFRDMYTAIYVKNSRLSQVEKLYHLLKKTTGEAHEIVKKVPLTNEGFDIAWENLKSQYENKRILINQQLRILHNLPNCARETGSEIKNLQREINNCISALQLYKIVIANWDAIFVYQCSVRLPEHTLSLWEQSISQSTEMPKWQDFDTFLTDRFRTLETVSDIKTPVLHQSNKSQLITQKPQKAIRSFHNNIERFQCKLCRESHPLRLCSQFLKLSIPDRFNLVKKFSCCINCLAYTHELKDCKSSYTCSKCKKQHNTFLHKEITQANPHFKNQNIQAKPQYQGKSDSQNRSSLTYASTIQSTSQDPTTSDDNDNSSLSSPQGKINTCFTTATKKVLLGTALVDIYHSGSTFKARALIDPASECSFISERIQRTLKLPTKSISAQVSGLNGAISSNPTMMSSFFIGSPQFREIPVEVMALVVPKVTENLPSVTFDISQFSEMPTFTFANPNFNRNSTIDVLIGGDIYPLILLGGVRKNIFGTLVAQEKIFGWILTGPVPIQQDANIQANVVSHFTEISLNEQLKKFWEIEEVPQKPVVSKADEICEEIYNKTTKRNSDGRYIVDLPFTLEFPNSQCLGQSKFIARSQFLRNEKSLLKKPELKIQYDNAILEYLELDHMEKIEPQNFQLASSYYLPHHAVLKPESVSTKMRIVFNASCPSSNSKSLNDILYTGPVLQSDLVTLILKWRFFKFVFNADIQKMYRQILVNPSHTSFQRIIFRSSPEDELSEFELKTVTFGVNCAPYLAIRTLLKLADDEEHNFPLGSKILREFMYVDDVLAGAHDIASAKEHRVQLNNILLSAGFELRKWTSNSQELLTDLPQNYLLNAEFLLLEDKSLAKTLGVRWNAKYDYFYFNVQPLELKLNYTKREVLSTIARLFDPAGWLSPIIVKAKIIMQQLWLEKTDWDDSIKVQSLQKWRTFAENYDKVNDITLPRWVNFSPMSKIEFHAFSDASEKAYAAAIYVRVNSQDQIFTHLLVSKTKVAPVKTVSLPRLELCGAVLLAKLLNAVVPNLNLNSYSIYKWTDSTIVLSWLQKPPCTWKTFVANRVSTIIDKIGLNNWSHVDSRENPADLATRGVDPADLKENELWWKGPSWLKLSKSQWPQSASSVQPDTTLEIKPIKTFFTSSALNEEVLERFSSLPKALRVIAYIFRFFYHSKKLFNPNYVCHSEKISSEEIKFVKMRLITISQQAHFPKEYQSLLKIEPIGSKSQLLTLTPFLDKDNVLRANGRLASSPALHYNERHPIILAYHSRFARLLVEYLHQYSIHGENQLIPRLVRREFWVLKLKNLIKTTINNCKVCVIAKKRYLGQLMAALPPERVTVSRPFTNTGVDFAGPFEIKSFTGRYCKITKGYVCLFVCFSTKAIHLEAVSELSSLAFIAALARFVARRGCPDKIFSDNATNFVGAAGVLKKDLKQFIQTVRDDSVAKYGLHNLSWHFIPAAAPHMGGLWEAGVKSFKQHFRKVAGQMKYTFEEFATLLARIEACLNSRPLNPASENVADLAVLTPGHFLIGAPLLSPAEPENLNHSISISNRWKKVQAMAHETCRRWKEEYLKELHKRNKWQVSSGDVKIGDLVVVRQEQLCPTEWRLGRILKTYYGRDGRVRVADLKTELGEITRPIHKLVAIPQ